MKDKWLVSVEWDSYGLLAERLPDMLNALAGERCAASSRAEQKQQQHWVLRHPAAPRRGPPSSGQPALLLPLLLPGRQPPAQCHLATQTAPAAAGVCVLPADWCRCQPGRACELLLTLHRSCPASLQRSVSRCRSTISARLRHTPTGDTQILQASCGAVLT
jgi:hypothetical protein